MQSALRLAARRAAACASSHRGVATTTKAAAAAADTVVEREWVSALVQREVRAAKEEEALALLHARARETALVDGHDEWKRGFKMGYASCFLGWGYVAALYALYKW